MRALFLAASQSSILAAMEKKWLGNLRETAEKCNFAPILKEE